MATMSVPVTITHEASGYIASLGLQHQFDELLEHTKDTVPSLKSIEVTLEYDADTDGGDPGIVIWAHRPDPGPELIMEDRTDWEWGRWLVTTYPADVCRHFCMLPRFETADGR